ncbi:MAG: hypothetical protein KF726_28770 [Anaerolineae bacterium]|nr:hypothetical protein [Anaerolineae bacterium]
MRIIRWSLLVLLTLIAVTGGIVMVGRAQPDQNPLRALGFAVCEGKPCFQDVVLGETKWGEALTAVSALAEYPMNQGVPYQGVTLDCCGKSSVDDTATELFVVVSSSRRATPILVGDLLTLYSTGVPCQVEIYNADTYQIADITFPKMRIYATASRNADRKASFLYTVIRFRLRSESECRPAQG